MGSLVQPLISRRQDVFEEQAVLQLMIRLKRYWKTLVALVVDGYESYSPVCQRNQLTSFGGWAHAPRKFVESQRQQPIGKSDVALRDNPDALWNRETQ